MFDNLQNSTDRAKFRSQFNKAACVLVASCLLTTAGCEEQPRDTGGKATSSSKSSRSGIIGKRTQEIANAKTEIEQKGAKVASTKIVAKDPITLQGNAYVSIIGRNSQLMIEHALDLYHATNDRYPRDYDEFMAEIIKANNIALPLLPPYQKYGYDEKEHKLIILEYEDLK
jgi:hypothetical protein